MKTALENLIDLLRIAKDTRQVREFLRAFQLETGFNHFTYFHNSGVDSVMVSNYPEEWQDLYAKRSYRLIDPVVTNAAFWGPVYNWSAEAAKSDPDPQVRDFFEDATRFGLTHGIGMTVRIGHQYRAYLTMASDHENDYVSMVDPIQATVALAFLYKFFSASGEGKVTTYVPLTPRELACLSWLADGKSMKDIAMIMGIGFRTVRTHLDEAKEKLSAQNSNHMVSIATRLKLI